MSTSSIPSGTAVAAAEAAPRRRRIRVTVPLVLGLSLGLLGLALLIVDSDLLAFFVPMRRVVLMLLLSGAALLGIARWQDASVAGAGARSSGSSRVTGVMAIVLLLSAAASYYHEYRAYREVEVPFQNQDVAFSGTLYLPKEAGPHPAVVIAQGSLRAPRQAYHLFADNLVRRGFAVYSFDKRGTGASGGTYQADNNASPDNLALLGSDVAAAHETIRRHPEVRPDQVGLMGISMGGWLSPIAASLTDSVDFMVLVSGPSVSVGEEDFYSDLTGDMHEEGAGVSPAAADSMVMDRPPSGFDPRPLLRTLRVPTLWLFGEVDSSIPTGKSAMVVDSLVSEFARPYRSHVFTAAEHVGFMMRFPFDLADDFWGVTTEFLEEQTRTPLAAAAAATDERVAVESDGWQLIGDLRIPVSSSLAGEAGVPAAVLLNQAAGDRRVYRGLADELAMRGVASLRLDLPGHGESINRGRFVPGEVPRSPMIWDAEQHVAAALDHLRSVEGIDANRLVGIGASYSGEELAEAGRLGRYEAAYAVLSPGSFSEASIEGLDDSGVPWLFVAAEQERFLQEITSAVQARSRTADVVILPGAGHATDLLSEHPNLAGRVAEWLASTLSR